MIGILGGLGLGFVSIGSGLFMRYRQEKRMNDPVYLQRKELDELAEITRAICTRVEDSLSHQNFIHDPKRIESNKMIELMGASGQLPKAYMKNWRKNQRMRKHVRVKYCFFNYDQIILVFSGKDVRPHGVTWHRLLAGASVNGSLTDDTIVRMDGGNVLFNLQFDIQAPCRFAYTRSDRILMLEIDLDASLMGIPYFYSFEDALTVLEDKKMTVVLGLGENREPFIYKFTGGQAGHLLIAGKTGYGKSTALNSLLCQLLNNNSSDDIKLQLIDLKKVELSKYSSLKDYMFGDIVTLPDQVVYALDQVMAEMSKRGDLIESAKCVDIDAYNRKMPKTKKLPYLFVVVDELSLVSGFCGKKALTTIAQIGALGRFCGIVLIVCTQVPKREILPTVLNEQLTPLCFYTKRPGSMAVFGDQRANTLQRVPGRAFLEDRRLQSPYISADMVYGLIDSLSQPRQGETEIQGDKDILGACLDMGGLASIPKVYEHLKQKDAGITQKKVREYITRHTFDYESKSPVLIVDDLPHVLVNVRPVGQPGANLPRYLLPCSPDDLPTNLDDAQKIYDAVFGGNDA